MIVRIGGRKEPNTKNTTNTQGELEGSCLASSFQIRLQDTLFSESRGDWGKPWEKKLERRERGKGAL